LVGQNCSIAKIPIQSTEVVSTENFPTDAFYVPEWET
jgi:hypothetical protein